MNFPSNVKYTKEHEWIRLEGDVAYVGITDYAQEQLGDIVFVDIQTEGETLEAGETFGTIEVQDETRRRCQLRQPARRRSLQGADQRMIHSAHH